MPGSSYRSQLYSPAPITQPGLVGGGVVASGHRPLPDAFGIWLPAGLTTTGWSDESGNGRGLSVAAGAGTLGSIDGKATFIPAVNSPMRAVAASWTIGNPSTIYLFCRTGASLAVAQTAMDAGTGSTNAGRSFWRFPAGGASLDFGATAVISSGFVPSTNQLLALCGIVQAGTSDECYINNYSVANAIGSAGNGTMTGISLGGNVTPAQTWGGMILGCIAYAAQHNAAQREHMRKFAKQTWPSLSLAA